MAKKNPHPASVAVRSFKRGECIHLAGASGAAWRVQSGSVRLNLPGPDGLMFANLAVSGDVVGAETLIFGVYSFEARALTSCVLEPWSDTAASLLPQFAAAERRTAEVIALRCGGAAERISRLVRLLTKNGTEPLPDKRAFLPRLSDVADITDLAIETVSRVAAALGMKGGLPHHPHRTHRMAPRLGNSPMAMAG